MNAAFPLVDFVCEMSASPAVTDVTLSSDGSVALRQNGRIAVRTVDPLRELWQTTVETFFPGRGCDARKAYTTVLCGGSGRRLRATLSSGFARDTISVRILPERILSPDELLLPEVIEPFFLGLRGGLFLVAGPAGSGKTTSIASLLRSRSLSRGGKIISLEDPVEIPIEGTESCLIVQRELGRSMVSYADGLKEALLMDPDIISVQELREAAAVETALSAALSGHLVMASVHSFGAVSAIQRLSALLGVPLSDGSLRESLASCLEGILAQRLLPGRDRMVPVFELMLMRGEEGRLPSMERLLRQGNWTGLSQEIEAGGRQGMITWEESLRRRIEEGLVSPASKGGLAA